MATRNNSIVFSTRTFVNYQIEKKKWWNEGLFLAIVVSSYTNVRNMFEILRDSRSATFSILSAIRCPSHAVINLIT